MPTYEFRCPKGHDFEKFYRSIGSAPSEVHCPECGALAERQLSGGAGLVFKGSGFYITDYGKDGKKDQKAPVTSTASSEKSGSEKSDAGSAKSESSASATSDSKSSSESKSSPADSKPAAKSAPARKKDTK